MSVKATDPTAPVRAWLDEWEQRTVAAADEPDPSAAWRELNDELAAVERALLAALFAVVSPMCPPQDADDFGEALARATAAAADYARAEGWTAHRDYISPKLRTMIYRRDGYACVRCGADDITRLTIDHRHPVALGGGSEPENLRTLCKSCNSSKGARL